MKKIFVGMLLILAMMLYPSNRGLAEESEEKGPEYITTFEQLEALVKNEGKEVLESTQIPDPMGNFHRLDIKVRVFKKAGMVDGGWWTFFTVKHYYELDSIVVVVYKPETGSVIIIRRDKELFSSGEFIYSVYIEVDHSWVVWEFWASKESAQGMVALVFSRLPYLM